MPESCQKFVSVWEQGALDSLHHAKLAILAAIADYEAGRDSACKRVDAINTAEMAISEIEAAINIARKG